MSFYKKSQTALIIATTFLLPILYNIALLRYYIYFTLIMSIYEFIKISNLLYYQSNLSRFIHILIVIYWLTNPLISCNYFIDSGKSIYLLKIILITLFSDFLQQFASFLFNLCINDQKNDSISIHNSNNIISFLKYHPFTNLSPNKTIIGYIGGLSNLLLYNFYGLDIFLLFLLFIFGCMGDLFASYFKRINNVSEYSNLLGHHGGFLDRFDACIFNLHLIYYYQYYYYGL